MRGCIQRLAGQAGPLSLPRSVCGGGGRGKCADVRGLSAADKKAEKMLTDKGVKVVVEQGKVSAELAITVDYGYDVIEVAKQVQNKVKAAIENMTGLTVSGVNVKIAGVNIENGR